MRSKGAAPAFWTQAADAREHTVHPRQMQISTARQLIDAQRPPNTTGEVEMICGVVAVAVDS